MTQKHKSTLQALVEEVKGEMFKEGLRYKPRPDDKRYKYRSRHGKKIKPEFGMFLSKMMTTPPKPKRQPPIKRNPDFDNIQFRGNPNSEGHKDYPTIYLKEDVKPILRGKK